MDRRHCIVALGILLTASAAIYAALPASSIATSRMVGASTTSTTVPGILPGASTTSLTTPSPTTSTTIDLSVICGDASGDDALTASDALLTLSAAVGAALCDLCLCDADGSGAITASDALLILRLAVGNPLGTACPPCAGR